MHKSATFVGVQGHQPHRNRNVRRLLPLRPEFPATPEEPLEYGKQSFKKLLNKSFKTFKTKT
uniref:Uncharacterized protein n=1 Tax=Panagrolaimus sp. PS1159 TaxID=55785 RepID=A0AC35FBR5_9BILA